MRKLFMCYVGITMSFCIYAQAPQKMSYQCVIRNSSGVLVTNQSVGIRISILQGSTGGTVVFQESYNPNPQTNENGLISIEIGSGISITGTFSAINWADGPYFLRTETDPTGSTNYTIVGTTQLLSVPYAMYAKTAENGFSGNYNDLSNKPTLALVSTTGSYNDLTNKPTLFNGSWSSLTGKPTFAAVATSGSYSDLSNQPTINGSETKVTAGTNVTVTGTGTTASPYVINTTDGGGGHYIGEAYGGGIVFYVYDNGRHGLISATADQSTGAVWTTTAFQNKLSNAVRGGIKGGLANTERIIMQAGSGDYAAQICANYHGGNYGDWYLPSIYELGLLYLQKAVVGGFTSFCYWSSNEEGPYMAKFKSFDEGDPSFPDIYYSRASAHRVRAIRAF